MKEVKRHFGGSFNQDGDIELEELSEDESIQLEGSAAHVHLYLDSSHKSTGDQEKLGKRAVQVSLLALDRESLDSGDACMCITSRHKENTIAFTTGRNAPLIAMLNNMLGIPGIRELLDCAMLLDEITDLPIPKNAGEVANRIVKACDNADTNELRNILEELKVCGRA